MHWTPFLIRYLPGRVGLSLRARYYHKFFGNYAAIHEGVFFTNPENIRVGKYCSFGAFSYLFGGGGIEVGSFTLMGPGVKLVSRNHKFNDLSLAIRYQGNEYKNKLIIGPDVWLGANTIILPNVRIGRGAVIGAGSIITKDVDPFSIVVGQNRIIGNRLDQADLK